jgi:hypothetical protein
MGAEPPVFFENKGSLGHRRSYLRGLPTGNFNRCKKVKLDNFWSILISSESKLETIEQ